MKKFHERIKYLISKTEFKNDIVGLAEDIGIGKSSLDYYTAENDRKPGYETLRILAQYFRVSADYLLCLSEMETIEENKRVTGKTIGVIDDSTIDTLTAMFKGFGTSALLMEQLIQGSGFSQLIFAWEHYINAQIYLCSSLDVKTKTKEAKIEKTRRIVEAKQLKDVALLRIQRSAWSAAEGLEDQINEHYKKGYLSVDDFINGLPKHESGMLKYTGKPRISIPKKEGKENGKARK